jgi:DivIVA domain-containing protein
MPLTPEDVSNKRFTPVRLREGYDMGEVDAFLDEVESELSRLLRENDDLRSKLGAATDGAPIERTEPPAEAKAAEPAEEPEEPTEEPAEEPAEEVAQEPAEEPEPARPTVVKEAAPAARLPSEEIRVTTAAEASSAATKLLELATRNADELVVDARTEADQILQVARTDAERLQAESQAQAERLDAEARERAQQLDAETENRRREALGDIEREKTRLDSEVTNLRTFEREYRSRLKSYFSEQLAALEHTPTQAPATGEAS